MLEKAQQCCKQAIQLAPDDCYINSVLAYLYSRTGRCDEAIQRCQTLLKKHPDNVDALSSLVTALQVVYQENPTHHADALESSIRHAQRLTELESDNWKHFFDLGNTLFSSGQILEAIEAFESAARINPNESAFINLGTMYKCQGLLDKALEFYTRAYKIAPHSYMSNEFLATAYYYMEDFSKSVAFKEKALESFIQTETVGLHQMWGDLADAYRHTGQKEQAIEAYRNALTILERDEMRGNALIMDLIYKELYLLMLNQLDAQQFELPASVCSDKQMDSYLASDLYPTTYLKLAQVQFIRNNLEQSRRAMEKAASICPLFIQHPDLKPLRQLYFDNDEHDKH